MNLEILLIEDELNLARFLELELKSEGYHVTTCCDGMSGLIDVRRLKPNLVILDWMLPCISGPEICRRLRQTGNKIPIILLTAKNCIQDRVTGLDSGADDYLAKPFRVEELLARVRARLRGCQEQQLLQYSNLILKRTSREVFQDGQLIELTMTEFDLLEYFLLHPRTVISRRQLLQDIWQFEHCNNPYSVYAHISNLRSKLEQQNSMRLIHTIRANGYFLR